MRYIRIQILSTNAHCDIALLNTCITQDGRFFGGHKTPLEIVLVRFRKRNDWVTIFLLVLFLVRRQKNVSKNIVAICMTSRSFQERQMAVIVASI